MAQYFTPNNIRWFTGGAIAGSKYYDEINERIQAAKEAGNILRRRYDRYYYTGSLKKLKPLGATNSTRAVARKTVRRSYRRSKMPMRRRMMRRGRKRRTYRRRYSKKSRWQAKARRMVGNPRNYSVSKTTESVTPGTSVNNPRNAVSATALISIGGTSNNSINDRQRDTCVVSGIMLHIAFKNDHTTRLWINWAVVHPKQGQAPGPSATDLFRDYTNQRAFDATSINKTGLTWSVAQINTDEYVVMKRGKFMLTPVQTATAATQSFNYGAPVKDVQCYIKVGRQFYFDDGESTPQDQIYLLVWCSDSNEQAGNALGTGISYRRRAVVYFREPRQG